MTTVIAIVPDKERLTYACHLMESTVEAARRLAMENLGI